MSESATARMIASGRSRLGGAGYAVAVYVLATLSTDAHFMADTADYVESVVARVDGRYYKFWEFGHLLWRPFAWLCYEAARPAVALFAGADTVVGVTWTLVALNWIAGLAAVVLLRALALRVAGGRAWAANVAASAFVFSHGFLNNAQTGSSYVPGLALLLLGLNLLARDTEQLDREGAARGATESAASARATRGAAPGKTSSGASGLWGGAALALAVCLWTPYLWTLPGALAAPLLLARGGGWRARLRLAARATAACAATGVVLYAVALGMLGVRDAAGVRAWIAEAAHGNTTRGLTRAVFGLARSFVFMGNDGVLFKRYLIGDPFNPVSLWTLFRLSLVKLALFYAAVAAVAVRLLLAKRRARDGEYAADARGNDAHGNNIHDGNVRGDGRGNDVRGNGRDGVRGVGRFLAGSYGRRVLLWAVACALPVFCFAVLFDGGAIERYLPLYPFVFAALACALASHGRERVAKFAGVALVVALAVVNAGAMLKPVLGRRQDAAARRVAELQTRLKPESRVFAVTWLDDLINFNRSFPFHPANRGGQLKVYALVTPGTSQPAHWREEFAAQSLAVWRGGGDVWVSRRAWAARPESDWNWVEGDERAVSWADFPNFFSRLEAAETVGGEDGFVRLAPTPSNERALAEWAAGRGD